MKEELKDLWEGLREMESLANKIQEDPDLSDEVKRLVLLEVKNHRKCLSVFGPEPADE